MKVVYCAGCYSAPTRTEIERNVVIAEEHGKQVLEAGFVPIIPHKNSSHWDMDERFMNFTGDWWLHNYCYPMLKKCDVIYLYEGWEKSPGARLECEFAAAHGIPIVHSIKELIGLYSR